MRCLLVLGLLDLDRDRALAMAITVVDDILAIHGCPDDPRARLRLELSRWLGTRELSELRLYAAKRKIDVRAVSRDGATESRVFEGQGCELSPIS